MLTVLTQMPSCGVMITTAIQRSAREQCQPKNEVWKGWKDREP
jgi:hypothetical protein